MNAQPPAPPRAPARILVVDDQPENRDMLERRLLRSGYAVVSRESAADLETVVAEERIDLVLLDWMMPDRSGLDALVGLRRQFDLERMPVIIVTALESGDVVAQALKAGANDYVSKPIDYQVLLARLTTQLDRRDVVRSLDQARNSLESTVRQRSEDLRTALDDLLSQKAERESAEARAQALALYDSVTGLPNRQHLIKVLTERQARGGGDGRLAVVNIALDRFRLINELYGRSVGDRLLGKLASRLGEVAGVDALLARTGGDEFTLALRCRDDEDLVARLTALAAVFETPFTVGVHPVHLAASLGAATAADDVPAETLLDRADIAVREAKADGARRWVLFEAGMDTDAQECAQLSQALPAAIRDDLIEPYFQPLVSLRTGEVSGYEILARWRRPDGGLVQPVEFIAIAEETGQIGALSLNLLRRACRAAALWPDAHRLSLNISPMQLRDPTLPQKVLQILTECAFPPARLAIEITEDGLVSDFEGARAILESFRNLGMKVALDDFGIGYSSLGHLRELPCDVLKIDRSFVTDVVESAAARSIVKTIIDLAASLSLKVTAEGVETPEQAAVLLELGCDWGQGFLYGRPSQARADLAAAAAGESSCDDAGVARRIAS